MAILHIDGSVTINNNQYGIYARWYKATAPRGVRIGFEGRFGNITKSFFSKDEMSKWFDDMAKTCQI